MSEDCKILTNVQLSKLIVYIITNWKYIFIKQVIKYTLYYRSVRLLLDNY